MGCPKCQCEEISASGMCLWCGYQINAPGEEPKPSPTEDRDSSTAPAMTATEELSDWRRQLSQRLLSIKQQHDASGSVHDRSDISPRADSSLAESGPSADSKHTQKVIDDKTSGRFGLANAPFKNATAGTSKPTGPSFSESLMLLLSRTLSGLVDLIIVGLSTCALILAADIFSGIQVIGFRSIANYVILFLLIYFMYSLFFFRTSSQTIGMMMTNLRLVAGAGRERPRVGRILLRCFGFLLSLFCFGIGLLWAFFDREHRCFHDRLTNTRVVRV